MCGFFILTKRGFHKGKEPYLMTIILNFFTGVPPAVVIKNLIFLRENVKNFIYVTNMLFRIHLDAHLIIFQKEYEQCF